MAMICAHINDWWPLLIPSLSLVHVKPSDKICDNGITNRHQETSTAKVDTKTTPISPRKKEKNRVRDPLLSVGNGCFRSHKQFRSFPFAKRDAIMILEDLSRSWNNLLIIHRDERGGRMASIMMSKLVLISYRKRRYRSHNMTFKVDSKDFFWRNPQKTAILNKVMCLSYWASCSAFNRSEISISDRDGESKDTSGIMILFIIIASTLRMWIELFTPQGEMNWVISFEKSKWEVILRAHQSLLDGNVGHFGMSCKNLWYEVIVKTREGVGMYVRSWPPKTNRM